jgi:hypothetical protein
MARCDKKNTLIHDLNFVPMHNLGVDAPLLRGYSAGGKNHQSMPLLRRNTHNPHSPFERNDQIKTLSLAALLKQVIEGNSTFFWCLPRLERK